MTFNYLLKTEGAVFDIDQPADPCVCQKRGELQHLDEDIFTMQQARKTAFDDNHTEESDTIAQEYTKQLLFFNSVGIYLCGK